MERVNSRALSAAFANNSSTSALLSCLPSKESSGSSGSFNALMMLVARPGPVDRASTYSVITVGSASRLALVRVRGWVRFRGRGKARARVRVRVRVGVRVRVRVRARVRVRVRVRVRIRVRVRVRGQG